MKPEEFEIGWLIKIFIIIDEWLSDRGQSDGDKNV